MHFGWAKIRNVRLLKEQAVRFHPELNLICGDNGAGKTTLLECLQVLGRGISSGTRGSNLVSHGEKRWVVQAGVFASQADVPEDQVRVSWMPKETRITVNDQAVSLVELARRLPVLAITPHSHRIMEEGPGLRRRYLDWGVFHMEQDFHPVWRRMMRVLSQRNAAIRSSRNAREVRAWDSELSTTAQQVTAYRQSYVERLDQLMNTEFRELLDGAAWTLQLDAGWRRDQDYAEVLQENLQRDLRQGFTGEGPHRAELRIRHAERRAKHDISRGQQKLLVSAMILAQCQLYQMTAKRFPVLLYDDLAAELSARSQARLMQQLDRYAGQKFITSLDNKTLMEMSSERRMFHMEHGNLTVLN
jgi:DNA replication and repair protein RecF